MTTKEKILEAARELFRQKGVDGVNMRELAEAAGVNKGLLHYYYKTKQSIFKEVFSQEARMLLSDLQQIVRKDIALEEKISAIVDRYFQLLTENPKLPQFVLFEASRDADLMEEIPFPHIAKEVSGRLGEDLKKIGRFTAPGDGLQFLLDIISLCVFFFAMRPLVQQIFKDGEEDKLQEVAKHRKEHVKSLLIKSLQS